MNYIKKIKSLGFKKIPNIVVCEYEYNAKKSGKYIELASKYMEERKKLKLLKYAIRDCHPSSALYYKSYTYQYKLSESLSLYIIIVIGEYTLVVKDDSITDTYKYDMVVKNNVYIPIHSNKLWPNFWKDSLNSLNKGIQREILIKSILK